MLLRDGASWVGDDCVVCFLAPTCITGIGFPNSLRRSNYVSLLTLCYDVEFSRWPISLYLAPTLRFLMMMLTPPSPKLMTLVWNINLGRSPACFPSCRVVSIPVVFCVKLALCTSWSGCFFWGSVLVMLWWVLFLWSICSELFKVLLFWGSIFLMHLLWVSGGFSRFFCLISYVIFLSDSLMLSLIRKFCCLLWSS